MQLSALGTVSNHPPIVVQLLLQQHAQKINSRHHTFPTHKCQRTSSDAHAAAAKRDQLTQLLHAQGSWHECCAHVVGCTGALQLSSCAASAPCPTACLLLLLLLVVMLLVLRRSSTLQLTIVQCAEHAAAAAAALYVLACTWRPARSVRIAVAAAAAAAMLPHPTVGCQRPAQPLCTILSTARCSCFC